ncbi:hypothetical protein TNCV_4795201 [Trichonephila clavipes]|nr:hypothetical protein TNCV_4795201 [Trichonephila clavipes]
MHEVVSHGRRLNDFKFEKGQIIVPHQSNKETKEIVEITGIWFEKSVRRIIKPKKDSGEPSTSQNKCG